MNTASAPDTATASQIADILKENPGKVNAMDVTAIQEQLRQRSGAPPAPSRVEALIGYLVEHRHLPIAECDRGYFYIRTREELDEYVSALTDEIIALNKRREAVERAVRVNPYGFEDEDQATLHTFEE